jgi:hypothetical protein
MSNQISYHLATNDDIEGVLVLQSLYHISQMTPQEMSGGFVTTPFSVEQILEIISQDGLFVAKQKTRVVAYIFAGSWQYFSKWPIFEFMITKLPNLSFDGVELNVENSFQYGPICIHQYFRGTQLFVDFFEFMRNKMKEKYPIALSFINKLNERSFKAHTNKLDWNVIDDFSFNEHNFYFIAKKI